MQAAVRYCLAPHCPRKGSWKRGRCPQHDRQHELARPHAAERTWYHTKAWLALRDQVLRAEPWCVDCLAAAGLTPQSEDAVIEAAGVRRSTDADHQIPHRFNATLFWDRRNLRGRCHQCHTRKTGRGE